MKKICYFFIFVFLFYPAFAEDPDYGNDTASAELITPDAERIYGELSSTSDNDWFKFANPGLTYYRISFNNTEQNWKYYTVYSMDDLGVMTQTFNFGTYFNSDTRDFFIEPNDEIYIKIYGATGNYSIDLVTIGTFPEDSYSNECANPTPITVDAGFVEGTITHFDPILQLPADEDWFEFETQPLHTYRVLLQDVDNDQLNFYIYNEDCEYILTSRDATIVSLTGESYKIRILGNAASKGEYYRISVSDTATYTDDYPNFRDQAYEITPDGTEVYGNMDYASTYNSDIDWFKFTPTPNTLYRIYFNNLEYDWKYLTLYQENAIGVEVQYYDHGIYYDQQHKEIFIESSRDIYLRVRNDVGNYWFSVVPIQTYPPDNYSNDCQTATQLIVDEPPIEGTINRPNPDTGAPIDVDWFKFTIQPLHKYQVVLTRSDYANVNFILYNESCSSISGGTTNLTFVAASGMGDEYKIYVYGDASRIGEYYTISVMDLGQEVDDYPNTIQTADTTLIASLDGTQYGGNIDYAANVQYDVDVFEFVAPMDGTYTTMFDNATSAGWMYMALYKESTNPGVYQQISNVGNYFNSGPAFNNFSLTAGVYYLRFAFANSTDTGPYVFSIVSPEPRCGDLNHPYPASDANKDCVVDLLDLAEMATEWMIDNRPID